MQNSLEHVALPVVQGEDLPGLYVHIPFCIKKCSYCTFYSITDTEKIEAYLSALNTEAGLYAQNQQTAFSSIYIGGGTPSVLTADQILSLFRNLRDSFSVTGDAEITFEVNPGDCSPDLLGILAEGGVTRINLGIQSFDDRLLLLLGRRHNGLEAKKALAFARSFPAFSLGLDLIYCVPGQSLDSWLETLREAVSFQPDHISCYQLTLEDKTTLAQRCLNGELEIPAEETQAAFFYLTSEFLEGVGYSHYEVSNFSRPGKESRHNLKYWNHTPYLGLGPSAHSFRGRLRQWNHQSFQKYINYLELKVKPIEAMEFLTDDQFILETLFLGFRTKRGIDLNLLKIRHGYDLLAEKRPIIDKLIDEGLLILRDGHLSPTRNGMAVADSLAKI